MYSADLKEEWLERWDCDRHGLGSKPTCALCCVLEETLYGTFSCFVVLASSSKF